MLRVRFSYPAPVNRSVAQPGSASGLGPEGPRFESLYSDHFEAEYGRGLSVRSHKPGIAGSNPASATNQCQRDLVVRESL